MPDIARAKLQTARGIAPATVELGEGGVAHLEPLGSGCRIRKGEQRHDDYYHAFIARARAQPQDSLARCGQLLRALLSDSRDRSHRANALRGRAAAQLAHLSGDPRPTAGRAGFPSPVAGKTLAMPAHDS